MKKEFRFIDLTYTIDLQDKVCVLMGNSGEGKTFLFDKIFDLQQSCDLVYRFFNWKNYKTINWDELKLLDESALIVFDNADLYLVGQKDNVDSLRATVIISCKFWWDMVSRDKFEYYKVEFDEHGNICMERK